MVDSPYCSPHVKCQPWSYNRTPASPPMSPDRDTDKEPPNSEPEEGVYVENAEGEPRMAGTAEDMHERDRGGPSSVVSPVVYGALILVGVAFLVFPEPATSAVGLVLIALGLFLAGVDALSPG